ncbi:MAG: NAD(P)-dependent oxidoreductase [Thermoplasmata archaeon]
MEYKNIGFAGLGMMGYRIAKNLVSDGYNVLVYNRSKEKSVKFSNETGSRYTDNLADLTDSDIIFTMVSDPDAVKEVYMGKNGLTKGNCKGKIFIDMSTVSPETSIDVYKIISSMGGFFLEAPVIGSIDAASSRKLVILVGGDIEIFEKVKSILEKISKQVIYAGIVGNAMKAKIVNNFIMGMNYIAAVEGIELAKSIGVDPNLVMKIMLLGGGAYSKVQEIKKDTLVNGVSKEIQFTLKLLAKDLGIADEMAKKYGAPIIVGSNAIALFSIANKALDSDKVDYSDIIKFYEKLTKKT